MHPTSTIFIAFLSLLALSHAQSYCGRDYAEATSCVTPCPSDTDADCPKGQRCFGLVVCGANDPQTAECGGGKECPLKACCSKWGYCGWTEEFCNDECQSNCEYDVISPSCDRSPAPVTWGYYASWAARRGCRPIRPEGIRRAATWYTHLAFSFAFVNSDGRIVPADSRDISLYTEFNSLKQGNPGLKTVIAVGGWAFNDPPTQKRFSSMASTGANRATFINSVIEFCERYGFDGVDLDWEYPAAPDRGGVKADKDNYAKLVREMRQKFDQRRLPYSITMAVPLSNWYLRHFDLEQLEKYLDFFNVMSYDLHGVWDGNIPSLGPYVKSHTNMTEIKEGLKMFYKNGVAASRLVLGIGAYGRSWTLEDPRCSNPGCRFKGPGRAGKCTGTEGFRSYFEIRETVATGNYDKNQYDEDSESMYLVDGDQWISYDSIETFQTKRDFAKEECMLGTMMWSVDMIEGDPFGRNPDDQDPKRQPDDEIVSCLLQAMNLWFEEAKRIDMTDPWSVTCLALKVAAQSSSTKLLAAVGPCMGIDFSVYEAYTVEFAAGLTKSYTAGVVSSSNGDTACFHETCEGFGANLGASAGYVVGVLFSGDVSEMEGFSTVSGSDIVFITGAGYSLSQGDSGVWSFDLAVSGGVSTNFWSTAECEGGLFDD